MKFRPILLRGGHTGRRDCVRLVGAAALVPMWPLGADAQTGRTYRIGLLETAAEGWNSANLNALRTGRWRLEGQNLVLICRSADPGAESWPALAAQLLPFGVDLIVTPAARAAEDAATRVPVVMAAAGEPLAVGVVASLARPGGNIASLGPFATELSRNRASELPPVGLKEFMENVGNPVFEQEREDRLVSYPDLYYRATGLIDRGAASEDLPVEPSIKLETVIHLKTAKALGIPTTSVADEVSE